MSKSKNQEISQTNVLFLRSDKSKNKFAEALNWVKAQKRVTWLPLVRLWALDTETNPTDSAHKAIKKEAEEAGWTVAGDCYIEADYNPRSVTARIELTKAAEKSVPSNSGGWSK